MMHESDTQLTLNDTTAFLRAVTEIATDDQVVLAQRVAIEVLRFIESEVRSSTAGVIPVLTGVPMALYAAERAADRAAGARPPT